MVNEKNIKEVIMPESVREAVSEFFKFTDENSISYWDSQDWVVERYSNQLHTLFFRPLFSDHDRMCHMEEFEMANDFLREKSGYDRLQVGFFTARGKGLMSREALRASRIQKPEETDSNDEIDYSNLKEALSVESIFKKDERKEDDE